MFCVILSSRQVVLTSSRLRQICSRQNVRVKLSCSMQTFPNTFLSTSPHLNTLSHTSVHFPLPQISPYLPTLLPHTHTSPLTFPHPNTLPQTSPHTFPLTSPHTPTLSLTFPHISPHISPYLSSLPPHHNTSSHTSISSPYTHTIPLPLPPPALHHTPCPHTSFHISPHSNKLFDTSPHMLFLDYAAKHVTCNAKNKNRINKPPVPSESSKYAFS